MFRPIFLLGLLFIAHACNFESRKRPPLYHIPSTAPLEGQEGRLLQQAYENIRIYADYSNLEGIDSDQRDYIQNQIMPSAIDYYQNTLKVIRFTEPLTLNSLCGGYTPPANLASPGVNADLVILVIAEDLPDETFVAGAVPCGLSLLNNRPTYGLMLFNLAYLPMEKVTDHQENLSTALHELVHVLGFNSDFYSYYINPTTGQTLSGIVGQKIVNDNYVTFLDVEPLTSKLRTYFNCSTLEGAYLEDQGDAGSAGSHFERRVFMNEYMTASSITEPVISEFTLALLEGTGWYQANYNMTEPFSWGKGQGCKFLDGTCVNDQGAPNFNEFCDPDVQKGCSWTNRGLGFCGTGQYLDFFADSCTYYESTPALDCKDSTNQAAALIPGEIYGTYSRCFTGTLVPTRYQATYGAYCFTAQCNITGENYELSVTVGTTTIKCQSAGQVSITDYNGVLYCPDPNDFCLRSNPAFCEKGCSGRGTCVNNLCQCPDGWGGTDCAERNFVENCTRCVNQTSNGCYGDQCRAINEIKFDDASSFNLLVKASGKIFGGLAAMIVVFSVI